MTKEHLIQCIKYIGSLLYNFPWEDLIVSIFSAFIDGIVAFYVAKYQVKKSNDQNHLQRKQDIKQQQLFMIDELKLKMSQEILDSTITVNANILNMINLRYKMQ